MGVAKALGDVGDLLTFTNMHGVSPDTIAEFTKAKFNIVTRDEREAFRKELVRATLSPLSRAVSLAPCGRRFPLFFPLRLRFVCCVW